MTSKPQFVGQKVTIGELGRTQSGGTPSSKHPEYFGGSIPWIGTTALNGKLLDKNDATKLITEEAIAKSSTKLVPQHSIMVGIRVGVGKVAINAVPMCTSQDIVSIVGIDENSWNKEYISLALQYKAPLLAAQAQGATITGITSKTLKSIAIPVIPLERQNEIVRQLRKTEWQMDSVREQLVKFDALVKSRFVEMFSECRDKVKLSDICSMHNGDRGKNYPSGSDRVNRGMPFVNAGHLRNGRVSFEKMDYITEEKYKLLSGGKIHLNDILYCLRGSLGKCAIADFDGGTIASSMMIIRPNQSKILPTFLYQVLTSPEIDAQLKASQNGSSQPNLSAKSVGDFMIPLPEFYDQQEFVCFAMQADKSRFAGAKIGTMPVKNYAENCAVHNKCGYIPDKVLHDAKEVAEYTLLKLQELYDSLTRKYFAL